MYPVKASRDIPPEIKFKHEFIFLFIKKIKWKLERLYSFPRSYQSTQMHLYFLD